jgi:hypothetical protein
VLAAERGETVAEATENVLGIIASRTRRFRQLRAELPGVCTQLALSEPEQEDTLRYADALEMWAGGYEPWHRSSPRYREALSQRPPEVAWAYEKLLDEGA